MSSRPSSGEAQLRPTGLLPPRRRPGQEQRRRAESAGLVALRESQEELICQIQQLQQHVLSKSATCSTSSTSSHVSADGRHLEVPRPRCFDVDSEVDSQEEDFFPSLDGTDIALMHQPGTAELACQATPDACAVVDVGAQCNIVSVNDSATQCVATCRDECLQTED